MITSKHITKIAAVLTAAAFLLCVCAVVFRDSLAEAAGDPGIAMDYETALFDTDEIMSVDILMDEDDWNAMLDNAASEEYYECDVVINGETYHHVGIRPKGNTSLTSIASDPDTDRFSLKLEFDQFVEGQTCHGLDKLILNNNYADATNMKEALIYDMYQYLGVDASLYNYASISVNGEYWGVYLALEAVEDSFMLRNYGTENGDLYKPDSMNIGGAVGGDFDAGDMDFSNMDFSDFDAGDFDFSNASVPDGAELPDDFEMPADGELPEDFEMPGDGEMPAGFGSFDGASAEESAESAEEADGTAERPDAGSFDFSGIAGMMGGFSMSGSGADLNYTDDDPDSYSTIWEGAVTDSGTTDHNRVIQALKNVSEGVDLEDTLDVDNILRYMAVHVFSVNDDSLTGAMAHNYYLYESDGMLNIIPWDYNLSFGGMGSSNDASSVVNDAIDGAFTGTDFFDTLMEDEEYHEQYYAYLLELVDEYINGGGFDEFYSRVRSQIDTLVETDPTAFYSYEEYLEAADTLYQVVKLRGESIEKQIDGTIASYASERSEDDELVECSGLDLSVMGSMNTGGGMNTGSFSFDASSMPDSIGTEAAEDAAASEEAAPSSEEETEDTAEAEASAAVPGNVVTPPDGTDASDFDGTTVPEGFDPSQIDTSELPEGFDPSQVDTSQLPEGFDPSQIDTSQLPEGAGIPGTTVAAAK